VNTAAIEAAQPGDVIRDDKVRGLQLRAFDKGKAFYLYYRTRDGRQRKPKVGDWPTLTLPKARTIARTMLDEVAFGGDPSGKRTAARRAPTVADMADRYMIEHGNHKKSKRDDERLIRLYIRPKLGRDRAADLEYTDVADWHAGIRAAVQANRALALLSTMLNMAERWGWRTVGSNPCRHVRRHRERRRRRYMTAEEAAAVFAALDARAESQPHTVAFIKLLIYTGARKGEIAVARWSDLDGDILRLPDSKSGDARTIHLPQPALDAIAGLPRTSGTICLIDNPYKTWYAVREEAGCPDLRMHDLRHSFASAALSAGLDLAAIGELLGHKSAQTTKGYAHLMEDAGRAAATLTAETINSRTGAARR
jgi:integrase